MLFLREKWKKYDFSKFWTHKQNSLDVLACSTNTLVLFWFLRYYVKIEKSIHRLVQSEEKMIPINPSKPIILERARILEDQRAWTIISWPQCESYHAENKKELLTKSKSCSIGKQNELWKDKELDRELVNFLFLEEYVSSLRVLCVSF